MCPLHGWKKGSSLRPRESRRTTRSVRDRRSSTERMSAWGSMVQGKETAALDLGSATSGNRREQEGGVGRLGQGGCQRLGSMVQGKETAALDLESATAGD